MFDFIYRSAMLLSAKYWHIFMFKKIKIANSLACMGQGNYYYRWQDSSIVPFLSLEMPFWALLAQSNRITQGNISNLSPNEPFNRTLTNGQNIQEWPKWNLWKTAFEKILLVHSWIYCPLWQLNSFYKTLRQT